jgi:hypothetical protein
MFIRRFMLVPCHLPDDGGSIAKFEVGQVLRHARSRQIANSRDFREGVETVISGEKKTALAKLEDAHPL